MPLHSSLGDRTRLHLKKKKREKMPDLTLMEDEESVREKHEQKCEDVKVYSMSGVHTHQSPARRPEVRVLTDQVTQ